MKIKVHNFRHAWLILYFVIYILWFVLDEKLVVGNYTTIHCALDDMIPFCEYFVVPYVLWYPFYAGVGVYLLLRDEYDFCRYVWTLMIGMSACLIIYLIFPNGQDLRPDHFERDNLFSRLVAALYSADTNTNVLPSMHVYGTLAPTIAIFRNKELSSKLWIKLSALVLCVLIILATTFIKQHSVLDSLAAAGLFLIVYFFVYRFRGGKLHIWTWPASPLRDKHRE